MKKPCHVAMQGAVAALICSAALLAGCSIVVLPDNVPPIKGSEGVSLTGVSCIVTAAEQDSTEYVVLNDKGAKTGIRVNRQAWSKKLVIALASELAKRGSQVRINAPLTLSIALPEVTFTQIGDLNQFVAKVTVSSSTGWSRNYEGIAEAGLNAFESTAAMANRLAGRALADAIRVMLRDGDFLEQLKKKS